MSEFSLPKTWREAAPYLAWGCVILALAFACIDNAFSGNFGRAFAALIFLLLVVAVTLHSKTWLMKTDPNWAFAGIVIATITALFILYKPSLQFHKQTDLMPQINQKQIDEAAQKARQDQETTDAEHLNHLQQQLANSLTIKTPDDFSLSNFGAWLHIINDLCGFGDELTLNYKFCGTSNLEGSWPVLITNPPESEKEAQIISEVLKYGLQDRVIMLPKPDPKDLDMKEVMKVIPTGVIIHGKDNLTSRITSTIPCFDFSKSSETIHGLDDYYKTQIANWIQPAGFKHGAPSPPIHSVLWIQIGRMPWGGDDKGSRIKCPAADGN